MKGSTQDNIEPNCQDKQSSRSQDEVIWDTHALLYFPVDKTSLVKNLMSDDWPKKLSLVDKMALVPGEAVNVRLHSLHYKADCCVGTQENGGKAVKKSISGCFRRKRHKYSIYP